jgi:hypothetical protein
MEYSATEKKRVSYLHNEMRVYKVSYHFLSTEKKKIDFPLFECF